MLPSVFQGMNGKKVDSGPRVQIEISEAMGAKSDPRIEAICLFSLSYNSFRTL